MALTIKTSGQVLITDDGIAINGFHFVDPENKPTSVHELAIAVKEWVEKRFDEELANPDGIAIK